MSKEDQSKYYEMAKKERQMHMQLHPNWSARDNYAKHKKKRRKRDKVRDGGSKKSNLIHRNCRLMFLWFFKIVYMSYFCQGIFCFAYHLYSSQ